MKWPDVTYRRTDGRTQPFIVKDDEVTYFRRCSLLLPCYQSETDRTKIIVKPKSHCPTKPTRSRKRKQKRVLNLGLGPIDCKSSFILDSARLWLRCILSKEESLTLCDGGKCHDEIISLHLISIERENEHYILDLLSPDGDMTRQKGDKLHSQNSNGQPFSIKYGSLDHLT